MEGLDEALDTAQATAEPITCTVGDLILAIAEAAEEATIGPEHIAELTQVVFHDMLRRCK